MIINIPKNQKEKNKFIFLTEYGEIADLAGRLKDFGHEVLLNISESEYKNIYEGMIDKEKNWFDLLKKDYIWQFDGCNQGHLQDWLRKRGEWVLGGTEETDELENQRQKNQEWFKELGFNQPFSQNFTDIDEAIEFVEENSDMKFILKQNGDMPKSINHKAHFDNNEDLIYHLKELKKGWSEANFGKFDCDLMEVVEGTEVACSAFFNGHDWIRNKEGKVIGFLNFEEKKEIDGDLGETTGEMGTTFYGTTEDNELFSKIMMNPKIKEYLAECDFHGVFDINGTLRDDGTYTAFEPTSRPGVPSTSYEFIEGLQGDPAVLLEAMAKGLDTPVEINEGVGMVMVIAAAPFPTEVDLEETATSLGEKLWIKDGDELLNDFTEDQKKHIHLYNFKKCEDEETGEICYKVATKSGYLLTLTGRGETVEECRENLIEYIKDNIYISGQKWRSDIGRRVEDFIEEIK